MSEKERVVERLVVYGMVYGMVRGMVRVEARAMGIPVDSLLAAEDQHGRALDMLRRYWGYESFRPGQWDAISGLLSGRNVLAVLPTGTGKSLCFQLPALLREGVAVCVSPLIALMTDQVGRLNQRGIPATYIGSNLSRSEQRSRWSGASAGSYRLVYIAPEQLKADAFRSFVANATVSFVAIDEAHCISEWGHAFRPAFRRIGAQIPRRPIIAVTATATARVQSDIIRALRMSNALRVATGFDRPNIHWSVERGVNRRAFISRLMQRVEPTIAYCATRRSTDTWAAWLRSQGVPASSYHAGMDRGARLRSQDEWTLGRTAIMVATSAFGMGIDRADVRRVVHLAMPGSLSAYYQEAGRAGRDGQPAEAILLYRDADVPLQRAMIEKTLKDALARRGPRGRPAALRARSIAIRSLNAMRRYVFSKRCRRHTLLVHFGEPAPARCGSCETCDRMADEAAAYARDEITAGALMQTIAEGRLDWSSVAALPRHERTVLGKLARDGLLQRADDLDATIEVATYPDAPGRYPDPPRRTRSSVKRSTILS